MPSSSNSFAIFWNILHRDRQIKTIVDYNNITGSHYSVSNNQPCSELQRNNHKLNDELHSSNASPKTHHYHTSTKCTVTLKKHPQNINESVTESKNLYNNNNNNNNNNKRICIVQVCRMTSEALDGQLQSCYTARARPKCLTEDKCFKTTLEQS